MSGRSGATVSDSANETTRKIDDGRPPRVCQRARDELLRCAHICVVLQVPRKSKRRCEQMKERVKMRLRLNEGQFVGHKASSTSLH